MKTVLIAVYSHPDSPFIDDFYASRDTWDSVNVDGVETVYYFPKEWTKKLPRTIAVDMDGGPLTGGKRALLAFKWMLDHKSWDYMARVNASCYVRKKRLLDYVQTLPATNLFQGKVATQSFSTKKFVWGGCYYIISRDVVRAIVDNGHLWDHSKMEDVSMSELVEQIGIPWTDYSVACSIDHREDGTWLCNSHGGATGAFEMKHRSDIPVSNPCCFIRVKQYEPGFLKLQIQIMHELHQRGI